ncbi:alpha-L-fucosidase [Opitutales bacterium ASA1]|nr:alpha-L-fucosidase [Opitutales bacterium ASA1]
MLMNPAAPLVRRRLALLLSLAFAWGPAQVHADESDPTKPIFKPDYRSLEKHETPAWFHDAKLGIFIHWGIYSVPGWAPPQGQFGKLPETEFFARNPYAEWYFNSMRIEGSPTHEHHLATYGADFAYERFADTFNEEVSRWDADIMAEVFRRTHARYVVLTTKHHDGFTLWPSAVPHPTLPPERAHASRDIVGELAHAVHERGMRMGVYYSGGIDWSFHPVLIDGTQSGPQVTPPDSGYTAYADAHLRELIERYRPSILWNDIRYPDTSDLMRIVADYYNADPDGVINNRWGRWMPNDFTTAEYTVHDTIMPQKWEANRGIGNSFGYNRAETEEHMLSLDALVDSFVDIVSKNGNLLLNVGPTADGTIPEMQLVRLRGLGRWLDVNAEAIFDTRPWVDAEGSIGGADTRVRFTYKAESAGGGAGGTVFAALLDPAPARDIVLERVIAAPETVVRLLGVDGPLTWKRVGDDLHLALPPTFDDSPAHVLAISPQPARVMRKP